jgi:hypothetical protein
MVAGVNCHHFLSYPCVKFDSFFRLEGIKNGQKQPPVDVPRDPSPGVRRVALSRGAYGAEGPRSFAVNCTTGHLTAEVISGGRPERGGEWR